MFSLVGLFSSGFLRFVIFHPRYLDQCISDFINRRLHFIITLVLTVIFIKMN